MINMTQPPTPTPTSKGTRDASFLLNLQPQQVVWWMEVLAGAWCSM